MIAGSHLRKQGTGGPRKPWTLEQLRAGFIKFHIDHGHYPTGPEVDRYEYLPSSRSIELRFGGIIAVRRELALGGQDDYRTGVYSSERAKNINKRAQKTEQEVYAYLCDYFGKEFVHREYFFTDDARTRADFFVYDNQGNFCVDVFYPKDYRNLTGCLNNKLQKYTGERMQEYPIIFLQMNREVSQEEMDKLVERKDKKFIKGQHLMGWENFQAFCQGRRTRKHT